MDFYNEYDKDAAQWTRNLIKQGLIPDGKVEERSITELGTFDVEGANQCHFFSGIAVWSHALELAGWPRDVPVWTGSCPCQPFSGAGKQKRFNDERHLWPVWFKLIQQCKPPVIFGEQVASALDWLELVQDDLEGAGYAFTAFNISAAGVGAPHIRQRIYFAAVRLADYDRTRLALQRSRGLLDGERKALGNNVDRCGTDGGLGNAHGEHPGRDAGAGHSSQGGAQLRSGSDLTGASGPTHRGLGNPHDAGLERRGSGGERGGELAFGSAGLGRFWENCEWVACRDGKIRPVEPGTFPLVDGAPARVVKLRAYGNAIVAPLAQAFIEEVIGALTE